MQPGVGDSFPWRFFLLYESLQRVIRVKDELPQPGNDSLALGSPNDGALINYKPVIHSAHSNNVLFIFVLFMQASCHCDWDSDMVLSMSHNINYRNSTSHPDVNLYYAGLLSHNLFSGPSYNTRRMATRHSPLAEWVLSRRYS
jgi:hypothetical protein